MMLVQLLAGMKDANGHVLIPHFYDGIVPLGPMEKQALASAPDNDDLLRKELALGHVDGGGRQLRELINDPSLNINGNLLRSDWSGLHQLHPPNRYRRPRHAPRRRHPLEDPSSKRVIDYVRSQGYFITTAEPTREERLTHPKVARIQADEGSDASRTSMDLPIAMDVIKAIESARGKIILLPTSGGTVPLEIMERAAQQPAPSPCPLRTTTTTSTRPTKISVCKNLWDGIETMAALIAMP